jgi:hypothetical protein
MEDFGGQVSPFISARDHARFKMGHAADALFGNYILTAAHHDTLCPVHHGENFNNVRQTIANAFEGGNYYVQAMNVGNTLLAEQSETDEMCGPDGGDGQVAVVWLSSHCGNISANETWNGVHFITCPVTILPGVTVTIQPGTAVKFESIYDGIRVQGTLQTQGTSSGDRAYFTSINDCTVGGNTGDCSPGAGNWNALWMDTLDAGVIDLDFVEVRYGGTSACCGDIQQGMIVKSSGADDLLPENLTILCESPLG